MKCAKCGKIPNKVIIGFMVSPGLEETKYKVRICPRCKGSVFINERRNNVQKKTGPRSQAPNARGRHENKGSGSQEVR